MSDYKLIRRYIAGTVRSKDARGHARVNVAMLQPAHSADIAAAVLARFGRDA